MCIVKYSLEAFKQICSVSLTALLHQGGSHCHLWAAVAIINQMGTILLQAGVSRQDSTP